MELVFLAPMHNPSPPLETNPLHTACAYPTQSMRAFSFLLCCILSSAHGAVEEVTSEGQFKKILSDNAAVVVDFYSQTCGPCIMMAPIFKDVRERPPQTCPPQMQSHS